MTWEQWKDFQILKGRKVLAEMASKDLQNLFNTLNWSHSVETKLQGLLIAKVSRTKYFLHAFFFFLKNSWLIWKLEKQKEVVSFQKMDIGELPGCQSAGCLMQSQIEWDDASRERKHSLKYIIWWHAVFISECMKESQHCSSRSSKNFNNRN